MIMGVHSGYDGENIIMDGREMARARAALLLLRSVDDGSAPAQLRTCELAALQPHHVHTPIPLLGPPQAHFPLAMIGPRPRAPCIA